VPTADGREAEFCGRDLLLAELLHRINNEYASAVSMMSCAAARSHNDEVKTALAHVSERLMAYAAVHRALAAPTDGINIDLSVYLRDLCESISRSKLADRGITLALIDRPFRMSPMRCWRLGLVVSELLTNAMRHAFGDAGGVIRVELVPSDAFVECRVSDNGHAAKPMRRGRGLIIVEWLVESLDGSIEYILRDVGSAVIVTIPKRANPGASKSMTIDMPTLPLQ
jgi:two-component sensor histidine kinase